MEKTEKEIETTVKDRTMESEMEKLEKDQRKPVAVFMCFGTKDDVYPVAAIAAGFASEHKQYNVIIITHSEHQTLSSHLAQKHVSFLPISSSPMFSMEQIWNVKVSLKMSDSQKNLIRDHRQECYFTVKKIFWDGQSNEDLIAINFFAMEGWSLAEHFRVRCIVVAPYVIPYSAPSSFERQFKNELPLLYKSLQESPSKKVCWKDVIHWMWPLFTEYWESWRCDELKLSPCPFTDSSTGLPAWHDVPSSPLLLYGLSKEVVECYGYYPSSARYCGFWFVPTEWQYSCTNCREISTLVLAGNLCPAHIQLQNFVEAPMSLPIFIGLSSIGSMGFLKDPQAFIDVVQAVIEGTSRRFILCTDGYEPLDAAIKKISAEAAETPSQDCHSLFNNRLFCFSGTIPDNWLFTRCAAAVHDGSSGTTAAALRAGIPQVVCPFNPDQFYWAGRMYWIGVAPDYLERKHLFPENNDKRSVQKAANELSSAICYALSPAVSTRAREISETLSLEDGVAEAVKCIREELDCKK